jgi:subtilisin family serine protease
MKLAVLAALAAALCFAGGAAAFDNTEPDAAQQWYLEQDKAWSFWPAMPTLAPIKVAVVDSGIDYGHPEFRGRIVAGRSFVSGSWKQDDDGHGTFVAGEIAADPTNGEGIAGLAFNAQLLIAKVVEPDSGNVSLDGEVAGIYWAVAHGARVINLSLGGQRDPLDPRLDYYSPAERKAVEYAYGKGVVVVAAVGNSSEAPQTPWNYADYPAALPHVIGVSALKENGAVPDYSDRDAFYVDLAAPGDDMFSTIPRNLIDQTQPNCAGQPYSNCGPLEFRDAIGTSFAAPQVSAAAALLLGVDPKLTPNQVSWLLERSATDMTPAMGCAQCPAGRDPLTGWGRLDVDRALVYLTHHEYPPPDTLEPNDDAGRWAHPFGPPRTITATLDYWDDPDDVYSLPLVKGQKLYARLTAPAAAKASLLLWKPGTQTVLGLRAVTGEEAALATRTGGQQRLAFSVPATGTYFLQVKDGAPTRMSPTYRLSVARSG